MKNAQNKSDFNFHTSYLNLSPKFYEKVNPYPSPNPERVVLNPSLMKDLNLEIGMEKQWVPILSGNKIPMGSEPFAQAYAGHQFGHFTMLGDGRAILLGEHIDAKNRRWDVQLKGGGKTPYSRRGDGKATLKSMLREYLMSEAMHYLQIPSSRSLAVVKSGEQVFREFPQEGAVLTRIMKSHLRIGTFEFARYYGGIEYVDELINYSINRLYPELNNSENKAKSLLEAVMESQMDMVINWLRVGFIHGVMNTDNMAISGESFDYGPCAFMGIYNPGTVFSSIDTNGRYSFGNQANILKWNLARFAETLISSLDSQEENAVEWATEKINSFDEIFTQKWDKMMSSKIGISIPTQSDTKLVEELLQLMEINQMDYTKTFLFLQNPEILQDSEVYLDDKLSSWMEKWNFRLQQEKGGKAVALDLMQKNNSVLVPYNFHVESVLDKAVEGNLDEFNRYIELLKTPYLYRKEMQDFMDYPQNFDSDHATFCGT